MKKLLMIAFILSAPVILNAQDMVRLPGEISIDRQFLAGLAALFVVYLISSFLLTIIKSFQEFRLKSKLIDRGVPENVVKQFIHPSVKDSKTQAIKWFLVLTALGIGLIIINLTQPVGFHSAAIMAFSIAFSFLAYYYVIKISEK